MKKIKVKTLAAVLPLSMMLSLSALAETVAFETLPESLQKEVMEKTKGGAIQVVNRIVEGDKAFYEIKALGSGVLTTVKVEAPVVAVVTPTPVAQAPVAASAPEVKQEAPKVEEPAKQPEPEKEAEIKTPAVAETAPTAPATVTTPVVIPEAKIEQQPVAVSNTAPIVAPTPAVEPKVEEKPAEIKAAIPSTEAPKEEIKTETPKVEATPAGNP